jgi:hypothetical protein
VRHTVQLPCVCFGYTTGSGMAKTIVQKVAQCRYPRVHVTRYHGLHGHSCGMTPYETVESGSEVSAKSVGSPLAKGAAPSRAARLRRRESDQADMLGTSSCTCTTRISQIDATRSAIAQRSIHTWAGQCKKSQCNDLRGAQSSRFAPPPSSIAPFTKSNEL